jgi:hypothetical protein
MIDFEGGGKPSQAWTRSAFAQYLAHFSDPKGCISELLSVGF